MLCLLPGPLSYSFLRSRFRMDFIFYKPSQNKDCEMVGTVNRCWHVIIWLAYRPDVTESSQCSNVNLNRTDDKCYTLTTQSSIVRMTNVTRWQRKPQSYGWQMLHTENAILNRTDAKCYKFTAQLHDPELHGWQMLHVEKAILNRMDHKWYTLTVQKRDLQLNIPMKNATTSWHCYDSHAILP